jgi:hypothetical protein
MRCLTPFATLLLLGCAPEQPEATDGCESIVECPIGKVCDRSVGECIEEPENRFLGGFHCTFRAPKESGDFEISEVSGSVATDHYSLPELSCTLYPDDDVMTVGFHSLLNPTNLLVFLQTSHLTKGSVKIGTAVDAKNGLDWGYLTNFDTLQNPAFSEAGTISFEGTPTLGKAVDGYIDLSMYPTVKDDVLFGVPCPRGLADCGTYDSDVGGADHCVDLANGPVCTTSCDGDVDCKVGDGVCVQGFCSKPCMRHEDCTPLRCVQGDPGQSNGCF